jgi:hypothetical protein
MFALRDSHLTTSAQDLEAQDIGALNHSAWNTGALNLGSGHNRFRDNLFRISDKPPIVEVVGRPVKRSEVRIVAPVARASRQGPMHIKPSRQGAT